MGIEADGDLIAGSVGTFRRLDSIFGATRWETSIVPPITINQFPGITELDVSGNVVVVGVKSDAADDRIVVAKLDAADGTLLWSVEHVASGSDLFAFDAVIDANGDVIVAAGTSPIFSSTDFMVLKISGVDGTELWRYTLGSSGIEAARAVALFANGDVAAAGTSGANQSGINVTAADLTVVRLHGSTGAESWRRVISAPSLAVNPVGMGVDPAGDVVVAGDGTSHGGWFGKYLVKLAGADGSIVWTQDGIQNGGSFFEVKAMALDPAGDVLLGGEDFRVTKLSNADGTMLWSFPITNALSSIASIATDAAGDVVAVGRRIVDNLPTAVALERAGSDGSLLWRTDLWSDTSFAKVVVGSEHVAIGAPLTVVRPDDGSQQLLDDAAVNCQVALDKAAGKYLVKRHAALAQCRNAINRGSLAIPPANCASDSTTLSARLAAGRALRALVAGRCTDAVLLDLAACSTTLDGLVNGSGMAGCLLAELDAAVDGLLVEEYGGTPAPLPAPAAFCQETIAKAASTQLKIRQKVDRKPFEAQVHGKATYSDNGGGDKLDALRLKIASAGATMRGRIATACTDALIANVAPCGLTLDALVASDGTSGCLVDATRAASDASFLAVNDP